MDHKINLEKKYCKSILSKAVGLRFHRKITDKAYIFEFASPRMISMDMVFVHFSIDVIFLDEKNAVIELKEDFRPYTFYTSKNMAKTVIETPQGYVKREKIRIGDKILY